MTDRRRRGGPVGTVRRALAAAKLRVRKAELGPQAVTDVTAADDSLRTVQATQEDRALIGQGLADALNVGAY